MLQGPGGMGVGGTQVPTLCLQVHTHRLSHRVPTAGRLLGPCDASASGCGCQLPSPARCPLEAKEPKESISGILSLWHAALESTPLGQSFSMSFKAVETFLQTNSDLYCW